MVIADIFLFGLVPVMVAVPVARTPPGVVGAPNVIVGTVLPYPPPWLFTVIEATR